MRIFLYLGANLSSIETTDERTPLIKAKREEPLRRGRSVWANRKRQRRIAPRSSTLERGQFIIIRQPPTRRSISSRVPTGCPVLTRCSLGFRVPRGVSAVPPAEAPLSSFVFRGRPPPRARLSRGRSRTPRERERAATPPAGFSGGLRERSSIKIAVCSPRAVQLP